LSRSLPQEILPHLSGMRPAGFHVFVFRDNSFIFYIARSSALRQTPNLEGQVPVFMFPTNRVPGLIKIRYSCLCD
jgi:hypothetical protein